MNHEVLKSSFAKVSPRGEAIGERLFKFLAEKSPDLMKFFDREDLSSQYGAWVDGMTKVILLLDRPRELQTYLESLGRHFLGLGLLEEHYPRFSREMIRTLEFFFDDEWTPELAENWRELFSFLALGMQRGTRISP